MDDDLIDDLLALYRRFRADNELADDEALAELIIWDLQECEILDLAADALVNGMTSIAPTRELAMSRIRELVRAFRKYRREDC